jgi:hypothetical protein
VEVIMEVERAVVVGPVANVLPGPSRTITVEPIKVPAPARPVREPAPREARPPEPDPEREREPVPAS